MITAAGIAALVAAGESETLELKKMTGMRREAAKTVCAMLNQQGGRVLLGVTPEGKPVGQQVSERTIEQLSEELARIDPPASPAVERVPVAEGLKIVVVSVTPGTAKPYEYRGSAYRRVGNTTRVMPTDEYHRVLLERLHGDQRWENQPAAGWSVGDLDATEIRRTVEEAIRRGRLEDPGTRDPGELLTGLGLCRDGVPLRAAAVVFGNERRLEVELPQCRLRVARFRGLDRMEFLDNRQFYGNAFALLRAGERFLRDTLPIASRFEPGRMDRIDEPLYPTLATREALTNALCHRDYSVGGGSPGIAVYDDRLEVTSPGTLHFGLTPEKLFGPHPSRPWNPLIARTFYRRGVIEEWGRGTVKIAEETERAGLPRPEIEDDAGNVTVRFRRAGTETRPDPEPGAAKRSADPIAEKEPSEDRQKAILALLDREGHPLALRDIRAGLSQPVDLRRLQKDLEALRARGSIAPSGRGRGATWARIRRADRRSDPLPADSD